MYLIDKHCNSFSIVVFLKKNYIQNMYVNTTYGVYCRYLLFTLGNHWNILCAGAEFMCDCCELIFTTQEKLNTHISNSHENEFNDKVINMFFSHFLWNSTDLTFIAVFPTMCTHVCYRTTKMWCSCSTRSPISPGCSNSDMYQLNVSECVNLSSVGNQILNWF